MIYILFLITISILSLTYHYAPLLKDNLTTYLFLPIVNDSGYNIFSSLFYSMLLVTVLYLISKVSKYLFLKIDLKLIISLIPFLFAGTIWRVIEDTNTFNNSSLHYVFISPIIYIFFTIIVCLVNYNAQISKEMYKRKGIGIFLSIIPTILLPLSISLLEQYMNIPIHIHPQSHVLLIAVLILLFLIFLKYKKSSYKHIIISLTGMHLMIIGILLILSLKKSLFITPNSNYLDIIYQTFGYTILFLSIFTTVTWIFKKNIKGIYPIIFQPIILLIIFGILLDGFTSIYSININHQPKHILTLFISNNTWIEYILLLKIIMIFFLILFIKRLNLIYSEINLNNNIFYILFLLTMLTMNFSPAIRVILRMCLNT